MPWKRIRFIRPLVLSMLVITAPTAVIHAGGFSNLDIGSHRCGMLATVASGEDADMVHHNPANLTRVEEDQFLISLNSVYAGASFQFRHPDGELSPVYKPTEQYAFVPFLGWAGPMGESGLTGALALYVPNLYGVALPEDAPTRYMATQAFFVTAYLTPALAYPVTDWLSVGAGLDVIYVLLENERAFNVLSLFEDDLRLYEPEHDFWMTTSAHDEVLSWHAGLTLEPVKDLRFSAVYYQGSDLDVAGEIDVLTPDSLGSQTFTSDIRIGMPIPDSWRFGISYGFLPRWTAAFDYNWWNYSDYRVQTVETGLAELFGFDLDLSTVKDYTNSKNMALGLQWQKTDRLTLMTGLQRDWSPVPLRTYALDNPILSYWGFSLGAKYELNARWRADCAYVQNEFQEINNRRSETSPPTNGIGNATWHGLCLSLLYRI